MTAFARTVALAAALLALAQARPGPGPQPQEPDGLDSQDVQALLDEFQAISERVGDRRRRAAPEEQQEAGIEPQNPDSAAVQGLIDEFQALSDRVRERRSAPAEPQAEAGPVQRLLEEFAESGRARRAAPPPKNVRVRREVEPVLLEGLKEFLDRVADKDEQKK